MTTSTIKGTKHSSPCGYRTGISDTDQVKKNKTVRSPSGKSRRCIGRCTSSLALACSLFLGNVGNARADWLVEDPTAIAKAVDEYANQAKRWAQTQNQYTKQATFWQQQMVTLQAMNFSLFTMQNSFKQIDPHYGVKDACPGLQGGLSADITTALQAFVPDMGKSVVQQQQQLCQLIVLIKNKKYNDTVDYLQTVAYQTSQLQEIETQRLNDVMQEPGKLSANDNEAQRFQGRITNAQQTWEANMRQDDAQIGMLQSVQANLSRRAMGGTPSTLGTVVNAAVLAGALSE